MKCALGRESMSQCFQFQRKKTTRRDKRNAKAHEVDFRNKHLDNRADQYVHDHSGAKKNNVVSQLKHIERQIRESSRIDYALNGRKSGALSYLLIPAIKYVFLFKVMLHMVGNFFGCVFKILMKSYSVLALSFVICRNLGFSYYVTSRLPDGSVEYKHRFYYYPGPLVDSVDIPSFNLYIVFVLDSFPMFGDKSTGKISHPILDCCW